MRNAPSWAPVSPAARRYSSGPPALSFTQVSTSSIVLCGEVETRRRIVSSLSSRADSNRHACEREQQRRDDPGSILPRKAVDDDAIALGRVGNRRDRTSDAVREIVEDPDVACGEDGCKVVGVEHSLLEHPGRDWIVAAR